MTTISDLSRDLVGEILSRVPLTSLSAVRSTCKRWNTVSKNQILGKKAAKIHNQFLEFMVIDSRVSSLRFDLQGIQNEDEDDVVDSSMMQITIPNHNQVDEISQVYHCDGLLLCNTKDNSSLIVWNPYLGQTKWIRPRNHFCRFDEFALGYDNNNGNHKILRFFNDGNGNLHSSRKIHIDVFDFSSDSWRVHDVNPNWDLPCNYNGVSLKGNTYFFGQEVSTVETEVTKIEDYLLCFDFTTERFTPRLPLPFQPPSPSFETVTQSWVRDEKLAVLYIHFDTFETIKIWISTKIEPNAVSWSTFLTLDTTLIRGLPYKLSLYFLANCFFIDEEKKVAVLFDLHKYKWSETFGFQIACIVGVDGYFKSVNIGVDPDRKWKSGKLVCSSYVPSLVHLKV